MERMEITLKGLLGFKQCYAPVFLNKFLSQESAVTVCKQLLGFVFLFPITLCPKDSGHMNRKILISKQGLSSVCVEWGGMYWQR